VKKYTAEQREAARLRIDKITRAFCERANAQTKIDADRLAKRRKSLLYRAWEYTRDSFAV